MANIDGVERCYGLPLLAFLSLAIPTLDLAWHRLILSLIRNVLTLPAVVAAAVGLLVVSQTIMPTFYLH
jgi:hypothetical protein